jgi:8-oxo-dGTP diphosphatase
MKPIHEVGELRVAAECCVVYKDKVLVQKRSADSKFFPNYLTFPGGHVDEGEDVVTAVVREVFEETGIKLISEDVQLRISAINNHMDRKQVWFAHGFYSEISEYVEPKSTDEGEVFWMNIDEFKKSDKVFPPIKYYLEYIFSSDKTLYMSAICEGGTIKKVTSEVKV